jgi:general secretion pathway protein M
MSSSALHGLKESVSSFWQERNANERAVLALAAVAIVSGLIYAILIGPALSGRAQIENSLPALRQQAAELQALSQQAAILVNTSAPPPLALSKESIELSLAGRGLKPQSVLLSGNLVKVQLASVSFAAMMEWLAQMQKSTRLSIVDANIVALPAPDSVNATLTLRQHRNGE